jgi:hypothetical protein
MTESRVKENAPSYDYDLSLSTLLSVEKVRKWEGGETEERRRENKSCKMWNHGTDESHLLLCDA